LRCKRSKLASKLAFCHLGCSHREYSTMALPPLTTSEATTTNSHQAAPTAAAVGSLSATHMDGQDSKNNLNDNYWTEVLVRNVKSANLKSESHSGTHTARSPEDKKLDLRNSNPRTSRERTASLGNRTVDAYYKHLERLKVPRTSSWVSLADVKQKPPAILKPLRLLRPQSKLERPKWVYGNPWKVTDRKEIRGGEALEVALEHHHQHHEPRRVGSPAKKKKIRPKTTANLDDRKEKSTNPIKRLIKSSKVVPLERQASKGKSNALEPLPSLAIRKSIIQTRGNREIRDGETSSSSPESADRKLAPIQLPLTKKKTPDVEVLTIHHEEATNVRTDENGEHYLSDEEDMKFIEAREIVEKVFEEYLIKEEQRMVQEEAVRGKSSMDEEIAAEILDDVFLDYLERSRPKSKTKKRIKTKRENTISPIRKGRRVEPKPPNSRLYRSGKSPEKKQETAKASPMKQRPKLVQRRSRVQSKSPTKASSRKPKEQLEKEALEIVENEVKKQLRSRRRFRSKSKSKKSKEKPLTKEEAANVIENAVVEYLANSDTDDDGETKAKNSHKVPKRLFTDFSDSMASDILSESVKEASIIGSIKEKFEKDREASEKSDDDKDESSKDENSQSGDDAKDQPSLADTTKEISEYSKDDFDLAVDNLVGQIQNREKRNFTNYETLAPNTELTEFNLRPKYNFVDLNDDFRASHNTSHELTNGHAASATADFTFQPEAGPAYLRPPKGEQKRRISSFSEKLQILRRRRAEKL
jgi:hypothetical protein